MAPATGRSFRAPVWRAFAGGACIGRMVRRLALARLLAKTRATNGLQQPRRWIWAIETSNAPNAAEPACLPPRSLGLTPSRSWKVRAIGGAPAAYPRHSLGVTALMSAPASSRSSSRRRSQGSSTCAGASDPKTSRTALAIAEDSVAESQRHSGPVVRRRTALGLRRPRMTSSPRRRPLRPCSTSIHVSGRRPLLRQWARDRTGGEFTARRRRAGRRCRGGSVAAPSRPARQDTARGYRP